MYFKKIIFIVLGLSLLVTACTTTPVALPTAVPLAVVPTLPPPTPTTPPIPNTPTPPPPTATHTPPPNTPTPRATQTPLPVDPVINILEPANQSQLMVGDAVVIRGLAQVDATHSVWVSLFTGDGRLLLDEQAEITRQGNSNTATWLVTISVPPNVIGINQLLATVRDTGNQIVAQIDYAVNLAVDTEVAERYLILDEPVLGQNVIAGHYMVVQGYSRLPSGNRIYIEVYGNDCQDLIADVSFLVGGTGSWFGYPDLPDDYEGRACLIAYAGIRGEPNWRETQTSVTVLAEDDPAASGITFLYPSDEIVLSAGDTFKTFGIAFNAVDRKVKVSIFLAGGELVAQVEDVPTDRLGYWEAEIQIPPGIEGPAILDIITGEAGDFGHAQTTQIIIINP